MASGGEPSPPWTDAQLQGDEVSKKDLVTFLQENGTRKVILAISQKGDSQSEAGANITIFVGSAVQFLRENKVYGKVASIAKGSKKDHLITVYRLLFETKVRLFVLSAFSGLALPDTCCDVL